VNRAFLLSLLACSLSACSSTGGGSSSAPQPTDVGQSPDSESDASSPLDAGLDDLLDVAGADVDATDTSVPPDAGVTDASVPPDAGVTDASVLPDAVPVTDASSGPWPTNPHKEAIPDPGWESAPAVGTVMPNFTAIDQYGQEVQIYDLAMEGKPIVLDVGTWFCEPCKSLAWYLATGETGVCPYSDTILGDLGWWNESYEITRELVDSGAIRWITILYSLGDPVTPQDAAAWHEAFPHDEVLVLADSTLQLQEYLEVSAMPRIDVLDENMVFLVYYPGGPLLGMKKIVELYGD